MVGTLNSWARYGRLRPVDWPYRIEAVGREAGPACLAPGPNGRTCTRRPHAGDATHRDDIGEWL